MGSCERARELAQAYLDGALEASERQAFEDHLRACPACRQVIARYRRLFAALAAPAIPKASADLAERTMSRVRVAARRRRAAQTAVTAAALVVCGIAGSLVWGLPGALVQAITETDLGATATAAARSVVALGEVLADLFGGATPGVSLPGWSGLAVLALAIVELALLAWWRLAAGRSEQPRGAR